MELTKKTLLDFAQSIPDKVKTGRDDILKPGQEKWDTYVRKAFAEALECWFCQQFSLSTVEAKRYIYVEGYNTIPSKLRGNAFFGTTMHPDAALIIDDKPLVAIELDHGTKGSQVRNALAKSGFDVLLGGFQQALVLFFVDQPKSADDFKRHTSEQEILSLYQKSTFKTTLIIL